MHQSADRGVAQIGGDPENHQIELDLIQIPNGAHSVLIKKANVFPATEATHTLSEASNGPVLFSFSTVSKHLRCLS